MLSSQPRSFKPSLATLTRTQKFSSPKRQFRGSPYGPESSFYMPKEVPRHGRLACIWLPCSLAYIRSHLMRSRRAILSPHKIALIAKRLATKRAPGHERRAQALNSESPAQSSQSPMPTAIHVMFASMDTVLKLPLDSFGLLGLTLSLVCQPLALEGLVLACFRKRRGNRCTPSW